MEQSKSDFFSIQILIVINSDLTDEANLRSSLNFEVKIVRTSFELINYVEKRKIHCKSLLPGFDGKLSSV